MQTLYRKYRPDSFESVLGQDHVVGALKGTIKDKAIGHAYLFAGSRGIGKTSIARIFAREIGTSEKDLYEIDAASNRGIDDIRELREAVYTLPFESPYKVYIIDEAHMLTKEAFNALLKTLEEPPSYAVFILATTEMHKLPETVVSRCETHHFKRPTTGLLRDMVVRIAREEGYQVTEEAAELIALLGDSSFRDTHGALQKVLRASDTKKIDADSVSGITGAPAFSLVDDVVTGLATKNAEKAIGAVVSAARQGGDIPLLARLIVSELRAILILAHAPGVAGMHADDANQERAARHTELARSAELHITHRTLATFLDASDRAARSTVPEAVLILAILESVEG